MDVGIQTVFASYGWPGITDGQVYDEETRLALLADELGFDVVWAVEHHFYDYSFCPDNTEWLAYIAGRTTNVAHTVSGTRTTNNAANKTMNSTIRIVAAPTM